MLEIKLWVKSFRRSTHRKQDNKISFPKSFQEFDTSFSLSQEIHYLRQKLMHARMILEKTLDTLDDLKAFARRLAYYGQLHPHDTGTLQTELHNISSETKNHYLTSCKILSLSEDVRLMVRSQSHLTRRIKWPAKTKANSRSLLNIEQ